jgi:hypothetical protein
MTNVITYDIDDPADARIYVKSFAPRLLGKKATYVQTNRRTIHFDAMTDEDACWVARQLWAMEQKAVKRGLRENEPQQDGQRDRDDGVDH